jgi:ribosomal protein S18 acetylase RimI-like enzyme
LESLQRFYGEFYPGTIFSSWMLEQPFFAIRGEREGEFLASGGVVAAHAGLGSANLGNFLTHPQHRGRGLAQAVTATLLHALEGEGYREFTLGTYEENRPACRVYEAVGFRLLEERIQADIAAG